MQTDEKRDNTCQSLNEKLQSINNQNHNRIRSTDIQPVHHFKGSIGSSNGFVLGALNVQDEYGVSLGEVAGVTAIGIHSKKSSRERNSVKVIHARKDSSGGTH